MGQKVGEYQHVDYWAKLMREADKAGATSHQRYTRPASTAREWDWYKQMSVLRTRSYAGVAKIAEGVQAAPPPETICVKCGGHISRGYRRHHRPVRSIYPRGGGRLDLYRCASCG